MIANCDSLVNGCVLINGLDDGPMHREDLNLGVCWPGADLHS